MEDQKKLYVGNLTYATTEDDLRKMFEEHGEIEEVNLITEGGRSKGFAFVTFKDASSATSAVAALDGKDVEGRPLTVNVAKPRKEQ